ncbi:MAG: hypothetical protein ACKOWO_03075 [Sediminibacterium sp.]
MKKAIAIFCFAALLLSTSSLSYFYWLQEKVHQQERFAMIDAGHLNEIRAENNDSKKDRKEDQIKFVVKDKSILPKGYHWEEKGREFSYKGMFYDIVSITKTPAGWEIIAASDEEEAAIVANQNKVHHLSKELDSSPSSTSKSKDSKIKLNPTYSVYESLQLSKHRVIDTSLVSNTYSFYATPILSSYTGEILHPPETV